MFRFKSRFLSLYKLSKYRVYYYLNLIKISKSANKHSTLTDIVHKKATLDSLRNKLKNNSEITLANIDQDGFIETLFDGLKFGSIYKKNTYTKRTNNEIKIVVLKNELLAIRKKYTSYQNFMMEAEILNLLEKNILVPKLIDINYAKLVSYLSFIPGDNLRLELYSKGARLLDSSPPNQLSNRKKWIFRILEARKFLKHKSYVEVRKKIFKEYLTLKKMGIEINDVKYGNVIINKSLDTVHFIDFDRSFYLPRYLRFLSNGNDTQLFKLHFFNLNNRSKI